ncbi:DNA excision repair protein 4 [Tieghemostelium lacteum]|uniref:DNA excision repair protein 4 n=1 Tax=Tieghemostelium lacteum TaxID=361077 RepID=A0A151Z837_TIELA|nr:DNA excision repair protein 4 [Tieghemostelium lacteum]|eukprot:KYQ90107.1 DNA excision repair protein 4 [Tieghemostelium lacteum]
MVLEYHKQVFEKCLENDGLVVMAQGLGIHHVILGFLKLYTDSNDLVLFIDVESNDSLQNSYLFYTERLLSFGIKHSNLPTLINQEHSGSKVNMYKKGGVYFSQASIFVLDFLTKRIPIDMVSGLIINNAHRISDTSTEYLLIKLFRQYNKKGFIKAFTTNPHQLTDEIGKLQRTLKYLHLTNLYIWPRFHQVISTTLNGNDGDTVELGCSTSQLTRNLLFNIQNTIKELFQKLKSKTKIQAGMEEIESNFETVLQSQLKPIWATLGNDSKQVIANIKLLKTLLYNVLSYDCVTFYGLLMTIKENFELENPESDDINQIFNSNETEKLFKSARDRVYKQVLETKGDTKKVKTIPVLDSNIKWNVLYQILQEIETENEKNDESPGNTIVFTKDEKTALQLQQYLQLGDKQFLNSKFNQFIEKYEMLQNSEGNNNNNNNRNSNYIPTMKFSNRYNVRNNRKKQISETNKLKKKKLNGNDGTSLFDLGVSVIDNEIGKGGIPRPRIVDTGLGGSIDDGSMEVEISNHSFNEFYRMLPPPYVIIHPGSLNILDEVRPKFIILYDIDLALIRMIECYKAENTGNPIRLYVMFYKNSIEESYYISTTQREKQAFEKLIHEKSTLTFDSQLASGSLDLTHFDNSKLELLGPQESSNMRYGGNSNPLRLKQFDSNSKKTVIIDSFEFKSTLPVVLHNKGFDIVPLRLEIGDYVITPQIAVERKSLSDLIGSFQSGRLYNQIEAMNRVYSNPVLLIEFDIQQPFYLVPIDEIRQYQYVSAQSLISKIVMLTMAFPRMRILWSRSSYSTANLYTQLKLGQAEPDPDSINQVPDSSDDLEYNYSSQDVLRSMPGITKENIYSVMNQVESLQQLSNLSLEQLQSILKSDKNGLLLYDFLNS